MYLRRLEMEILSTLSVAPRLARHILIDLLTWNKTSPLKTLGCCFAWDLLKGSSFYSSIFESFLNGSLQRGKGVEAMSWNRDQAIGTSTLLGSPNDWDEPSACNLVALLADRNVLPQSTGGIVWLRDFKGSFTIKSLYNSLHVGSSCHDFLVKANGSEKLVRKLFVFYLDSHQRKDSHKGHA